MDAFFSFPPSQLSIISILILFILLQLSYATAADDFHFTSCPPFDCGNLGSNISYPFWTDSINRPSFCGYADEAYKLKCVRNRAPVLKMGSQQFRLMNLNPSRGLMTIQREQLGFGQSNNNITCPQQILITAAFNYSDTAENITLSYGCRNRSRGLTNHSFFCKKDGFQISATWILNESNIGNECDGGGEKLVEIPVGKRALDELKFGVNSNLTEALLETFDVKYYAYDETCKQCKDSGGRCGSNEKFQTTFACYCRDGPTLFECKPFQETSKSSIVFYLLFMDQSSW